MKTNDPWDVYPRPLLRRDSFFSLNGEWKLEYVKDDYVLDTKPVRVPFAPQAALSGASDLPEDGTVLWYTKHFTLPEEMRAGLPKKNSEAEDAAGLLLFPETPRRVLLHFGAVDQVARVYLNGVFIGEHEGGYTAFSFDITDALLEVSGEKMNEDGTFVPASPEDQNELTVEVEDHLDAHLYPYGKQKHKHGGIWYTPVSGIWQTVWMENVPAARITDIDVRFLGKVTEIRCGTTLAPEISVSLVQDVDAADVPASSEEPVRDAENDVPSDPLFTEIPKEIREARLQSVPPEAPPPTLRLHLSEGDFLFFEKDGVFRIPMESPHLWSPEDPYLYEFSIDYGEDHVDSYFACRTLEIGEAGGIPRLCLNGKPYFFHGVLDQGYFDGGIYTPASPEAYLQDLKLLKDCGYNMLRKHIKIEPQLFYYYCDKMGIAVFQDMVNNGEYKYLRDTVFPALTFRKNRKDKDLNKDETKRQMFLQCAEEAIRQLKNHPSIVYWTIFNEGWGQFDGKSCYDFVKQLDDTRFIDTASGWFRVSCSDVFSDHIYFKKVKLVKSKKPYVLSEFGGYALKVEGHVYDEKKSYGYKTFKDRDSYEEALLRLYREEIVPAVKEGLCADVYTQLSDVEEEINGLVTYDRAVIKVDPEKLAAIADQIRKELNGEE